MTKILIIDDEAFIRKFLGAALGRAGYSVTEAADGCKGLQLYSTFRPDCVITDLYMPEKEGLETIMEMRHHEHRARIIAMSGGAEAYRPSFLKAAKQLGADAILPKPFTIEALLAQVERLCAPAHAIAAP